MYGARGVGGGHECLYEARDVTVYGASDMTVC